MRLVFFFFFFFRGSGGFGARLFFSRVLWAGARNAGPKKNTPSWAPAVFFRHQLIVPSFN